MLFAVQAIARLVLPGLLPHSICLQQLSQILATCRSLLSNIRETLLSCLGSSFLCCCGGTVLLQNWTFVGVISSFPYLRAAALLLIVANTLYRRWQLWCILYGRWQLWCILYGRWQLWCILYGRWQLWCIL